MTNWIRAFRDHMRLTAEPHGRSFIGKCKCGYKTTPKLSRAIANRSVGLHITAALKRADRADSATIEMHYARGHKGQFLGCEVEECVAAGSTEIKATAS